MSLFKKMMAKVGIGAAKVETELLTSDFVPGETMEALIKLSGGSTDQTIDAVYFKILSTYEDEIETDEDEEQEITRQALLEEFVISEPFTLGPGDEKEFPISLVLPFDTPVTKGKTKVWVQTGLDIKKAIDPGDRDYIDVAPHPLVAHCLGAVEALGFGLKEVTCEPAPPSLGTRIPFIQEFEFVPLGGEFQTRLDELELVFKVSENDVEVLMEIDRKAKGLSGFLSEILESDESLVRFSFGEEDTDSLPGTIRSFIESNC